MVLAPLEKTKLVAKVDVIAKVSGGGVNGQAEAVRHGLARALVLFDPNLKSIIKSFGYLRRDPRMVERKKFGLKKLAAPRNGRKDKNILNYETRILVNSERMNFLKPKRKRSSDRGRSVSGLKKFILSLLTCFIS